MAQAVMNALVRSSAGGNRTRPATAIYRMLMVEFERQRLARDLSMVQVDVLAGGQEGFYSKMIYPDTPSGRQSRWETVQEYGAALFGRDFTLSIVRGEGPYNTVNSALYPARGVSTNALEIRHWRHKRHFQELGRKGGKKFFEGKDKAERSAIMRKRAKKRWRRVRAARRQGDAHKAANAERAI